LLGAAMVCRERYEDALAYYGTAMELDDRYLADARIHEDVQRMLKNSKVRMATLDFLGTSVGKPALPVLIKTASSHEKRDVRRRAIELVAKLGAADKIDWVTHLGLDLLQNPDIEERKRIVARLHKMGDPRAIYYLRKARDQRVRYGFFRTKHKNWTIREEIIEAIKHLLEKKKDS
jgi:HEAT repeat protein